MEKREKIAEKKTMNLQLVLGNPKIGCDGYGICKFITKHDTLFETCAHKDQIVDATISIEDYTMTFVFDKNKMSTPVYERYYSKGVFIIETPIQLPDVLIAYFEIPPSVLGRGKYGIEENEFDLIVKSGVLLFCKTISFQYKTSNA